MSDPLSNNLYYTTRLTDIVSLSAAEAFDIPKYLLANLKRKNLNKAYKKSIIVRIDRITRIINNIIDEVGSMASANFTVEYECILCSPQIGMEVIAEIFNTDVEGTVALTNGRMCCIVKTDAHYNIVKQGEGIKLPTGELLKVGDKLKILIKSFNIRKVENYPNRVTIMAQVIGIPDEEELKLYDTQSSIEKGEEIDENTLSQFV